MSRQFRVRRTFSIQLDSVRVKTYFPREYAVPSEMSEEHAIRAAQQRAGRWLDRKVAPENKLGSVPENKAEVAEPAVLRRGPRSRSKRGNS